MEDSSLRPDKQSRVPSLSYYCYKYINAHLDSIHSLGTLPFSICEPILRSCSAEQLLTVENNSPHLLAENQEIWQTLCCRDFPRYDQSVRTSQDLLPSCWRERYFTCLREEEKRFEEIGCRLRIRREEVDQEKKERQVILTDKLFPSKRARLNPGTSKSRSLLAKAKADSLKVQRLLYGPSTLPTMHSKTIKPPPGPSPSPVKKPLLPPPPQSPTKPAIPSNDKSANSQKITLSSSSSTTTTSPTSTPPINAPQSSRNNSFGSAKKDPMAALFMPKHKAYSQRPSSNPTNPPIAVRRK